MIGMAVGGTTPYDFDIRPSQNSNMISTNMENKEDDQLTIKIKIRSRKS